MHKLQPTKKVKFPQKQVEQKQDILNLMMVLLDDCIILYTLLTSNFVITFLVICVQHSESAGLAEEGSSFHSSHWPGPLLLWTENQLSCAQTHCSRSSYVFSHWPWGNRLHLSHTMTLGLITVQISKWNQYFQDRTMQILVVFPVLSAALVRDASAPDFAWRTAAAQKAPRVLDGWTPEA